MSYQLGIDLGTTYTAAAICRGTDRAPAGADVVTLGTRSPTVASVLYLADDGSILVGEAAERRALTDPDRVVREFKRRIGDEIPMMIAGRPHQAHELAARMIRWVVDQVSEREGGPPRRIAITHPAAWGQHKKDLLSQALGTVGLSVTFLAEPQAAAVSYASAERVESGSTIAVYDLGGGTFDAAVVRKTGGSGFELLGQPEGIERLGGVDFDEVVFGHVREGIGAPFDELDPDDQDVLSAVARLRRECVDAKEALSSDTEATIPVLLPDLRTQTRLTRGEFEAMIRPALEETVGALRRAVSSAGLTPEDLNAVLLVGGSSRIPLVSQLVSDELGRPVAVDADPKTSIALGAALAISPQQQQQPQRAAALPVPQPDLGAGRGRPGGPNGPGGPGGRGMGTGMGPGVGAAAAAAGAGAYLANSPPVSPASQQGPLGGGQRLAGQGGQGGLGGPGGPPKSPPRPPARQAPPPPPPQNRPAAFTERAAPARPAMAYQRPEFEDRSAFADEDRRRQTTLLVGVGGVVAIVVIVAAIFLWPKSSDADSTSSTSDLTPEETTSAPPATHSSSTGATKATPKTTPRTTPRTTPKTTPSPAPTTTGGATTGATTGTPSTTGATTGTPTTTGGTTGTPTTTGGTTGTPTTTGGTTGAPATTGGTTASPSGATTGSSSGTSGSAGSTGTGSSSSGTGSSTGASGASAPSNSGTPGTSNGLQSAPQRPAPAISNQPVSQQPSDPPTGANMLISPSRPTSNPL